MLRNEPIRQSDALSRAVGISMAGSPVDVVAVVLNWRTSELAERCVESLLASRYDGSRAILVVDNNSGDDSADRLRSRFGDTIEVVESPENRGYAGGMNIGLVRAAELGAVYALLLNADIELEPNTLEELCRAAEVHSDGVLFGPRIFDVGRSEDRWFIGGRWDWGQGTIRIVRERVQEGLSSEPRRLEFVNGAAMFVRMSALEHIGMFDERFGLYFEESDLCSRAAAMGYTLWHVPRAHVWHVCGASMSKSSGCAKMDLGQYYRTRNRLLWGRKNLSGLHLAIFWLNILFRWPVKFILLVASGRVSKARGLVKGVSDFVRGRYGMIAVDL